MKKIVLTLVAVAAMSFVACKDNAADKIKTENVDLAAQRDADAKNLPVMTFEKAEHDFGNIVQGTQVETVFKFTNTGKAPLIITDAKSSCGCTVPEKPKDPIAPGETGELLVKFNGSGSNQVMKTITVTANTANGKETLRIKAFVTPKAQAGSPVKVSN